MVTCHLSKLNLTNADDQQPIFEARAFGITLKIVGMTTTLTWILENVVLADGKAALSY